MASSAVLAADAPEQAAVQMFYEGRVLKQGALETSVLVRLEKAHVPPEQMFGFLFGTAVARKQKVYFTLLVPPGESPDQAPLARVQVSDSEQPTMALYYPTWRLS